MDKLLHIQMKNNIQHTKAMSYQAENRLKVI